MTTLYTCHAIPTGWRITKFDPDLNVDQVYEITAEDPPVCNCPGWPRKRICKHTRMLNIFALAGAIDTDQFYCYETQMWHQPIAPLGEPPMKDKLDAFNEMLPLPYTEEEAAEIASSEGPELCQDEGCPQTGTPHVCISSEPVPAPEPPKSNGIRRL